MYHFSRAIYRDLAPYVLEDKRSSQHESNRTLVLRECESAIERLMTDRRYFARPPARCSTTCARSSPSATCRACT